VEQVITVKEIMAVLKNMPEDAKVYAWAPGSHMPVAGVMRHGDKVLLEVNVPAALGR
jgi:hypothetical protein